MEHNHGIPLFISFCLMLGSKLLVVFINIYTWHLPPVIMELSQTLAWWAVGITAVITVLNYFGIKWNPFKKKK